MKIVIKKKVSLDFLGDDYKEAYINFNAFSIGDFEIILDQAEEIKEDGKKSIVFILKVLKERFIDGKFPNEKGELEDLTADDLVQFDFEVVNKCFQILSGQNPDPKS